MMCVSFYDIVVVMNVFLVIPTIRNLDFLPFWEDEFKDCHLIIIEDHPIQQIATPNHGFLSVAHFTWNNIHHDFGKNEWIFSRQNAGIRSYGFWKAYLQGADVVITLDDDCYPAEKGFVEKHVNNLMCMAPNNWFPTFPHPDYQYTRGFPYDVRNAHRVGISHGLWSNKMDMDAKTQLQIGDVNIPAYPPIRQFIPTSNFFPMSSMNLAFTREITPLMYFPLMGKDQAGIPWGFDRYDDIWAGVFAKKIADYHHIAVVNGSPFVEHKKASDPVKNLEKEKAAMKVNESLWRAVERTKLTTHTIVSSYSELMRSADFPKTKYFTKLREAAQIWCDLFAT